MRTAGIVLEMRDPGQLRPSVQVDDLALVEVGAASERVGGLYRRIWTPIGGGGRSEWSDRQWDDELAQPGMRTWVAQLAGADVGLAEIGWSGEGDAAFVVLGVVPELQGHGIGGDVLSRLAWVMWETPAANGRRTERVWVWTVPGEHPHTITNYLARGFVRAPDRD